MAKKENSEELKEKVEEIKVKDEVEKELTPEEKNILKNSLSRETIESTQTYIIKKVKSVVFGVLSPKMIKKMATAKVVTPELYDKEGYPVDGGLMDIRLGVIDPGLRCKTCGSKLKECIGHFGYIELARPVFHIKFVKQIYDSLRCTCRDCGRLLTTDDKISKTLKDYKKIQEREGLDAVRALVKETIRTLKTTSKCPHCKAKQHKITLAKPLTFKEDEKRLTSIQVRSRLERIPDDDATVLGMNPKVVRPEWTVLTVLPIPPVTVRPSITLESGERSEDDLTHKLGDVVRINQRLFENINAGAPETIIEDLWDLLQYHVTTFFDNNVPQLPPARHRGGQPLKTITERISSKEGRIRHNLAGKRTNFCARTVISPDPMLDINSVGVPYSVAMKVTVPEVVNEWNMAYLKKFVEKGPKEYPGSNYIVRPDGKKKKITEETKEAMLEELQPGYRVERHLMDGDITIFNRQPSLHRMSMMCHKVKVLPYKTLRLNPAVCAPYNADFDGDEMNLHVPQTEESRAEAEILMQVQTQIVSPGYGLSVIGCLQDSISGNYILTREMNLTKEQAIDLLCSIGITEFTKLPDKKTVTGKEVFSVLLPNDLDYEGVSKSGDKVVITKGILKEGVMDLKSIGGEGEGLLLRVLHKQYGADKTVILLQRILRLGIEVLLQRGFTTSYAETDLNQELDEEITKNLNTAEEDVQKVIQSFHEGALETFPGRSLRETLEMKIVEILNKARNLCGNIIRKTINKNTHTFIMAESGARGNILNVVQMSACVGQQVLNGKRIEKGFNNRTLACFKAGDLSPEAHGFVKNCFKKGLNPKEFFFHAITGRDGLMDTALRTPKSGYLYRRLANAMQDLRVEYDGSVRDAGNKIIQFTYGEDQLDVAKTEHGKINVKKIIQNA
ncbi:DNA-directed RNA polymerase subunit A' [Candidatus Woesearchaeota archaeon CG10_big_fil_rev_8_21_14_0_10_30_7]|nr:MAG: DNA-directed RNA polymerase subunit A' [Candidatus Woesearchaeota archaeon CG10_big_fil_rev_8_21_14_0_10_30_7]